MSKIFGQNIDLNKNQALNFRLENQITFPSVTATDAGYVFFHSANDKFYGWDGTIWTELGAGGVPPASGLQNIVEDTTPQLGGNLDTQGFGIESSIGGAVFSLLSSSGNRRAKSVWETNEIYTPVSFSGLTTPLNPGSLSANFTTGEWTIGANRILTTLDLGSFVTTNTTQSIIGFKTFSGGLLVDDSLAFIKRSGNLTSASQGLVYFKVDNTLNFSVGTGVSAHNVTFNGIDSFTTANIFTLQDKSGTLAHLDDIPSVIEGSFAGTVIDSSGGATYTITTNNCYYTIIGNTCTLKMRIDGISTTGVASGQLKIGGIPLEARPSGVPGSFATASINISGSGIQHTVAHLQLNSDGTGVVLRRQTDSSSQNITFTSPASWVNGKIDVLMTYPLST